ncbi:unnamed protein product [Lampetra fluviatilis]
MQGLLSVFNLLTFDEAVVALCVLANPPQLRAFRTEARSELDVVGAGVRKEIHGSNRFRSSAGGAAAANREKRSDLRTCVSAVCAKWAMRCFQRSAFGENTLFPSAGQCPARGGGDCGCVRRRRRAVGPLGPREGRDGQTLSGPRGSGDSWGSEGPLCPGGGSYFVTVALL